METDIQPLTEEEILSSLPPEEVQDYLMQSEIDYYLSSIEYYDSITLF